MEPVSKALEQVIEVILTSIDCQERTIDGIYETDIDWSAVRRVWRSVALSLVTAARFRFDLELFNKRTELLEPFVNDHSDVYHRLRHERCLWAIYTLDFEALGRLVDNWDVEDCDPIWKIRKAALLWEQSDRIRRSERNGQGCARIPYVPAVEGSVAGVSREGWAMWSRFNLANRQEIRGRWHELAAIKCDAELEMDLIARRMKGREKAQEVPHFDLGVRRGEGLRFTNKRPDLDAYRAVRLTEVAGLPPITKYEEPVGLSVAADILSLAAVELASIQPELAIRLVLRVSNSEKDETLERVLPRTRAATLSTSSVESLADSCVV